jgi:hypothetical protein
MLLLGVDEDLRADFGVVDAGVDLDFRLAGTGLDDLPDFEVALGFGFFTFEAVGEAFVFVAITRHHSHR